jgi:hypothetical protein
MAERRSLFAVQRGIWHVAKENGPVNSFEIREKTPEELKACAQPIRTEIPSAGFPEPELLSMVQTQTEHSAVQPKEDFEEISRENQQKISQMTSQEVAAAKAEIAASLSPAQIALLRKIGSSKAKPTQIPHPSSDISEEKVESWAEDRAKESNQTCMAQLYKPEYAEDCVKFDIEGNQVQFYKDGKWTESELQGYTITEVMRLARSIVPAQRIIGLRTVGKIVKKRGVLGLNHMISNCGLLLVLRAAIDDTATSVFTAGLEAIATILTCDITSDLAIQRFDLMLYPRIQSITNNALLSSQCKASPELVEELMVKHDHSPEDATDETDTDIDLSCKDFLGTLIKTGLLMRLSYLLSTQPAVVSAEVAAGIVLASALHSVSGSFAIARTPGLLEHICSTLTPAKTTITRILTVMACASHALAISILKLREMWGGTLNKGLLDLENASEFAISAWDFFDQLLRYKIDVIPFEAFLGEITAFVGKISEKMSEEQGKLLGRIYAVLARRERGNMMVIPGYLELARVILQVCIERNYQLLPYKYALIGVFRYILAYQQPLSSLSFLTPWLLSIAPAPLQLAEFEAYYMLETEYSSALPRLNLYLNCSLWEHVAAVEVRFQALSVKLCTFLSIPGLNFDHILGQITRFLTDCTAKTAKDKVSNILSYRLHDLTTLSLSILQYMDQFSCLSPTAIKCSHQVTLFLGQYSEIHLNFLLTKWLFRDCKGQLVPDVLKYYLGLLSSSDHLSRSEHLILQECKLTSYLLCLSENRYLPVKIDYLYQPLRSESSHTFLELLLALETAGYVDYCPVHKKIAILNDYLSRENADENDTDLISLLTIIANNSDFSSNLSEIKENLFSFLRFYQAASFCSPLYSRWLATFLRPEVEAGIRKYLCQELEMLFVRMAEAIGTEVLGDPERYLKPENCGSVLDLYRFVGPRIPQMTFYAEIIGRAMEQDR